MEYNILKIIGFCQFLSTLCLCLQCKNEQGASVDWFLLYKLPLIQKPNYLLRKGLAYAYITSDDPSVDWKLSTISINDTRSIPGQTLNVLYSDVSNNYLYTLYNDEPPSSSAASTFGHTKGVVVSDTTSGYWLIHSSPKFPIEPYTEIKLQNKTSNAIPNSDQVKIIKNHYMYPKTATRFGQMFLCISLNITQLNNVGVQLMYNKPKIYSVNIPNDVGKLVPNLTLAANKKYIKSPPWYHKQKLHTISGTGFTSYAKAGQFNKELYSDWVAVDLLSNLNVETWSNGAGDLPSECTNKFKVQDIRQIDIKFDMSTEIAFKNSQDHSKWAVSLNKTAPWICVGDINRMKAQLKRGGGTVCFEDPRIWKKYSGIISEVEPCRLLYK